MKFRQTLFWDTDPKKIDPQKNAQYIIERVADLGRDKEARWVLDYYAPSFINEIIGKSRSIRPETRALWLLMTKQ